MRSLFYSEIKEKKLKSSGNRHRTSKSGRRTGSSSKVMFTSDLLSKAEKREYTKCGKVETYNMYETIIPRYEFELKSKDVQKAMLTRWREIYSNEKIMKEMGISGNATFYAIIKDLDIPQKARGGYKRKSVRSQVAPQLPNPTPSNVVVTHAPKPVIPVAQLVTKGLHLEYNGKYDAEQLSKILTKLQLLIEGEENGFNIEIKITEDE